MKIELEVPDYKLAFVMELLDSIPFIKARTIEGKTQTTTEYLLSSQANAERLKEAIERSKNCITEHYTK